MNSINDRASIDPNKDQGSKTISSSQSSPFHLPTLKTSEDGEKKRNYSLIVDLDETLIHYEEVNSDKNFNTSLFAIFQNNGKGKFFVRPYADLFLKEMSQYYEITIFTAAVKDVRETVSCYD